MVYLFLYVKEVGRKKGGAMTFYKKEASMDLGDTVISNIFLREYMPQADGNFVKVYLLAYGYALAGVQDKDNASLAKSLQLLESDVHRAWTYWQDQGIVEKIPREDSQDPLDYDVYFVDLKELYIKNVYIPSGSKPNFQSLTQPMSDPQLADLMAKGEFFLRRAMSYQEKRDLANWVLDYNMPPKMVEEALRYSTEVQNKYDLRYIQRVVQNWSSQGIRSMEALEANVQARNKDYYRYRKVMAAMGLGNKPYSQTDMKEVNSWFNDLGFSEEMVLEACSRSVLTANPNVAYIKGVLTSWYKKGIFTLEDIAKKDLKPSGKAIPSKVKVQGNKFHNFSQSSADFSPQELEDLARKKSRGYGKQRGDLE